AALQQLVRAQRARGRDNAARRERTPALWQPGAGALGDDLIAVGAVAGAQWPDVDHLALGVDLHPVAFGEPQVVLAQGVLGVVGAADHAAPAAHAPGALRARAAEERIGHGLAGLAQEHADPRLAVGGTDAE